MKKTVAITLVFSTLAFLFGTYVGYSEKVKDGQLLYYSTNMADVRGLLFALEDEDISKAPNTVKRLKKELKYQNETLNICILDDNCPKWIKSMVRDVRERANKQLSNL